MLPIAKARTLKERGQDLKNAAIAFAVLLVPFAGYTVADSAGLIPHSAVTSINASTNWLVGEIRNCSTIPESQEVAAQFRRQAGYAFSNVSCSDEPSHQISITFYGRSDQPEYRLVLWNCTRREADFQCREIGGFTGPKRL